MKLLVVRLCLWAWGAPRNLHTLSVSPGLLVGSTLVLFALLVGPWHVETCQRHERTLATAAVSALRPPFVTSPGSVAVEPGLPDVAVPRATSWRYCRRRPPARLLENAFCLLADGLQGPRDRRPRCKGGGAEDRAWSAPEEAAQEQFEGSRLSQAPLRVLPSLTPRAGVSSWR